MALPPPSPSQVYVKVSALDGGLITLPSHCFIHPADAETTRSVPSLAFLIEHPSCTLFDSSPFPSSSTSSTTTQPFRMLFDLGLRSKIDAYLPAQQAHLRNNRVPYRLGPSIAQQLQGNSISAAHDIAVVLLSHVHYDHHGDPGDFPTATFLVGPGSLELLRRGIPSGNGTHQVFDPDLLPAGRTRELSHIPISSLSASASQPSPASVGASPSQPLSAHWTWTAIGPFPAAIDLFGDSSAYIVHAPGHLPGHVNLLCRTGPTSWVYLAGDAAHDMRLVTGEKEVGTWAGEWGESLCIHLDRKLAEGTIARIRELVAANRGEGGGEGEQNVELVLAHDEVWAYENQARMFPDTL